MKFTYILAAAAVVLTVAAAPKAEAAYYDGVAATTLNVRAGPNGNYPIIGKIRAGSPVNIRNCIQGYRWCDVSTGGFRGWVAGKNVRTRYRDRNDNVSLLGQLLGISTVTYNERTYWGENYYDRDFYRTKYGWNDNDGRRYGWRKSNGQWVRLNAKNDEDHDGIHNKYDRYDNDGRGKYDNDKNWRQVNGKWVRVGDEDHDGVPNNRDNWDNDGRGRYDRDNNYNNRYQYNR